MADENKIMEELTGKFDYLKGAVTVKRERRIFADVPADKIGDVFDYVVKNMQFLNLSAITGLDENSVFGIVYHLNKKGKTVLSLKITVPRENPAINTVTGYFPSADAYERELIDLLGIKVEGLSQGHHYPLPDNWPAGEYPLRKDWKESACDAPKE